MTNSITYYVWATNAATNNRIYLKSVQAVSETDAIRKVEKNPPKFVDYLQGKLVNYIAYSTGVTVH